MKWYTLEERSLTLTDVGNVCLFHTKIFIGNSRLCIGQIYFDTNIKQYLITIVLSKSNTFDICETDVLLWIPQLSLIESLPEEYLKNYYDTTMD